MEKLKWVQVAQSCLTVYNPMDYTVYGISLQARILECVAYPFSSGSSRPRNWTQVSCIAGGFFTSWATREAHGEALDTLNKSNGEAGIQTQLQVWLWAYASEPPHDAAC